MKLPEGICDADVEIFTKGNCWMLAAKLHDLSGWPVLFAGCLGGTDEDFYWTHVAVLHPSGMVLDVMGLTSINDMLLRWHADLLRQPTSEVVRAMFEECEPLWDIPEEEVASCARDLIAYASSVDLTPA